MFISSLQQALPLLLVLHAGTPAALRKCSIPLRRESSVLEFRPIVVDNTRNRLGHEACSHVSDTLLESREVSRSNRHCGNIPSAR